MNTTDSSLENKRYNAEVNLLDGLYDFHPEFFNNLTSAERRSLYAYYLTDRIDIPSNIFDHRSKLIEENPQIEQEAHKVFTILLNLADIKDFRY